MSKKDVYKHNKVNRKHGEIVGNWLKWYFEKRTTKRKHKLKHLTS